MMRVAVLAALVAISSPDALAQGVEIPSFYTGDDLLTMHCSSPPTSPNFAVCRAYIVGIIDDWRVSHAKPGKQACVAPNVTQGEVTKAVVQWLQNHPTTRPGPAAAAVQNALYDLFLNC